MAAVLFIVSASLASAATLTWKTTSGTWDLSSLNWDPGPVAWTQTGTTSASNDAVFGGVDGTYTVTLAGSQIAASNLTFNASGYTLSGTSLFLGSGTVTVASGSATIGSVIRGTNGITKNGAGSLTLSAANTFSGGVNLTSGTLLVGNASALGSNLVDINGGSLGTSVASALNITTGSFKFSSDFSAPVLASGQLSLSVPMTLANGTRTINVVSGAGFNLYGGISDGGNGYGLIKTGNALMRLGGVNTYTGDTRVDGGTLTIWSNAAVQNSTLDTDGVGSFAFTGQNGATAPTIGGLKGSKNLSPTSAVVMISVNPAQGVSNTYSGGLSGVTGITKVNSGTQVFSGANTYSGSTTISAGVLRITGSSGLGFGGPTYLNDGAASASVTPSGNGITEATLDLNGNITVNKVINLTGTADTARLINSAAGATAVLESGVTVANFSNAGSNFSLADRTKQLTLSGGGGSGATVSISALATTQGTFSVVSGGTGWAIGNTVTISGGGSTTSAVYNVSGTGANGSITALTLATPGIGYTTLTGLTYTGAKGTASAAFSGTSATFSSTDGTLAVGSITMGAAGSGYTSNPAISSSMGSGFSGTTTIASMTLAGSKNELGGEGNLTIKSMIGERVSGASFGKIGSGTLILSASNSYTGTTDVRAGMLQIGNDGTTGSLSTSSVITGSAGATLAFNRTDVVEQGVAFANGIGGALGVSQIGLGTLTLSSSNGYSGGTGINAGVLAVANTNALGTGTVTIAGGRLQAAVSGAIANPMAITTTTGTIDSNANSVTLSGAISGTGGLYKAATSGTLVLAGENTFSGNVTVDSGTTAGTTGPSVLVVTRNTSLGTGPKTVTLAGYGRTLALDGGGGNISLGSTIGFTLSNDGQGAPSGYATTPALRNVAGDNIISGSITMATGGGSTLVQSDGGSLTLAGNVAGVSGQTRTLILDGVANGVVSGNVMNHVSGTSALTKRGAGVWALTGVNTYTGTTTVAAGMLKIGNGGVVGSLSTLSVITGSESGTLGFHRADTITQGSDFSSMIGGAISVSQLGTGTLALSGSNTYSGTTTAAAGVVRFDTLSAGSAAQALGSGSVVNLGVAATSAGELNYLGAGGTLDKNVFALGTGRNRVRNSGAGTLRLSGTLTKNGTILELAGGAFNVTGQITGSLANSDLYINGASVTLANTNNNYNGPTYVYGGGSLTLGASNVVPSGSALLLGGTGSDTGTGLIAIGAFTDTVASLTTSSLGGTVSITGSGTMMGGLTTTGNLTFGAGTDTLALSLTSLSLGRYSLLTYQGTRSGTFDTVTGLTDSRYTIVYGGTSNGSIDLQMKAGQATAFTLTPAASRVLVGGSTTLTGSLVNSSPAGAAALAWTPTVSGSLTGVSSSLGSSITAGGTSTITATFLAGNTAGSKAWSVVNTDNSAITTTSTSSGSIDVVNQRTFTTNTPTLALGNVHKGGSFGSPTLVVMSTGSYATTASASLGSFAGGPSGFSLGFTNGSAAFNGGSASQAATYTLTGSTGSLGAISGTFSSAVVGEFSGIPNVSVAVTGNVYSGQSVWATNGGGNWGTLSGTGVNAFGSNWGTGQGSPGLDAAFANVDTATFGSAFTTTGGTATINTNGADISLKSLTFDNASGSYSINQTGGSGSLTLLAAGTSAAGISVLAGSHTIHADVSLGSSTVIDIVTGAALTFHNAVSGSAAFGLTKIGGGTLYFNGGSDYAGNTDIREGMVSLLSGVNPLGTGIVTVYSGATLDLNHLALSNTLNVLSGGILLNTGSAQTVSVADAVIFSGTTNGTVDVGSGGNATFQSAVAGAVTVDGGGVATFTSSSPLAGSLAVSSGGMAVFNGSNTAGSTFNVGSGGMATVGLGATIGGQLHVSGSAVIAGSVAADADVIVQAGGLVKLVEGSSFAQTSLANAGTFVIDRSSAIELATAISGTGSVMVNGGRVNLSGLNTYSGQTEVTGAGSHLAVNGQVAGNVQVGTGAELGGSGLIVGTIGGDGLIAPGNSPGILTVNGQLAATGSTAFAFELSQTGAPNWSDATNSSNDVLRLTASSPFASSLANTNVVNVYFDVANLNSGDTFQGGFFVDNPASTANLLTSGLGTASFQYFVYGDGNGGYLYNGIKYYSFDDYKLSHSGVTGVTQSVVNVASANFSGGSAITTGQVTQFVIIPEPGTVIFAGIGIAMLWAVSAARGRRRV